MTQHAVTANRLIDGQVVYLTPSRSWSEKLHASQLAEAGDAADALLRAAEASVDAQLVVEPYLIPIGSDAGNGRPPRAVGRRETIRAAGPSVRPDLGHQASQE